VQMFVFFCFSFACSNSRGFFLFDVLCKCNLSRFYSTLIVSMIFFFPSFHLLFILFYFIYNIYYYEKGL
jgi:hypothetical protein